jgi:hypothetical protein
MHIIIPHNSCNYTKGLSPTRINDPLDTYWRLQKAMLTVLVDPQQRWALEVSYCALENGT